MRRRGQFGEEEGNRRKEREGREAEGHGVSSALGHFQRSPRAGIGRVLRRSWMPRPSRFALHAACSPPQRQDYPSASISAISSVVLLRAHTIMPPTPYRTLPYGAQGMACLGVEEVGGEKEAEGRRRGKEWERVGRRGKRRPDREGNAWGGNGRTKPGAA